MTWSDGFYGGRGKIGALVEKGKGPWQRNVVIMNFFGGKEDEDKGRQENGQTISFFSFQNCLFGIH